MHPCSIKWKIRQWSQYSRRSSKKNKYIPVCMSKVPSPRTAVRAIGGSTEDFLIDIGLHQGSDLSPFLFTIVMDKLTKDI